MPDIEKRKWQRFALEVPAQVSELSQLGKENIVQFLTTNVGVGGAFFQTNQSLPLNSSVMVDLMVPRHSLERVEIENVQIKVSGSVVRSHANGMAISFDEDYNLMPLQN